jgi:hypothetical protein
VAKRQRQLGGVDDLVISLVAKGTTTGEARLQPEPDSGQDQECAGPDGYRFAGERGVQPEVIGETAEQVGGGDDEDAEEQPGDREGRHAGQPEGQEPGGGDGQGGG